MSSVNKVILVGRLGKDPEVRYTNDNVPVANFSIATSEYYKDRNGERQESTEWHNIVAWRQLAEISEKYLRKGKLIYVEGKLRTRSWDDKEGNKRYATEIVADNITMLSKREDEEGGGSDNYRSNAGENNYQSQSRQPANQNNGAKAEPAPSSVAENIQIDDDLPF